MSNDDKFDLNHLVRPMVPKGPLEGISDAVRIAMLPSAGLVCPRCGAECKRLPNGLPSDSIAWPVNEGQTPFFHFACVQKLLAERDYTYIQERLEPWAPKEPDAPSL